MIDVLLAACSGERFLREQLASLRAQSFGDFRVLMQDDGSSDATPRLLAEACADPRFQLAAESGRHLGASGNFLSLLRQSGAEYAALCDQDDVWRKDRLSLCLEAMRRAEARWGRDVPLLVHSDAAVTDAQGRVLYESFIRHQGWDPAASSLPELLVQNCVTGCTTLVNAPLRRLVTGGTADVPMHDWLLAQGAAAAGHIVFVPEALVAYRQHGRNAIGASGSLPRRLLRAAATGRERMALTRVQAEALLAAAPALPEEARETVRRYLAIRSLPKLKRLKALREGGFRMQSLLGRIGMIVFG